MLTNQQIKDLTTCPKQIIDADSRRKVAAGKQTKVRKIYGIKVYWAIETEWVSSKSQIYHT